MNSNQKKSIFFTAVLGLLFSSCSNNKLLTARQNEIKEILQCESYTEVVEGKDYIIDVTSTKLPTPDSKALASSMASLVLYEEFYKINPSADYSTQFGVRFHDSTETNYMFELADLADVDKGIEITSNILTLITGKQDYKQHCLSGDCNKAVIEWSSVRSVNLMGFQTTDVNYTDGHKLKAVLFHYYLKPMEKYVWVYYDPSSEKIITIIEPVG